VNVQNAQIVTAFEADTAVLLSCGPALKELSEKLHGKIHFINAPDNAPPGLPRAVLQLDDIILNISLDRVQALIGIPPHISDDINQVLDFTRQMALRLLGPLVPVLPPYLWTGIVIELMFPQIPVSSLSANQLVTPIFDRLLAVDRKERRLSAFELQFGFIDGSYYITYQISGYEQREIEIALPRSGPTKIDPTQFPIKACGAEIVVDINNKPKTTKGTPVEDVCSVLDKHLSVISTVVDDLNLEGVLP
jgi:hypothetical protein